MSSTDLPSRTPSDPLAQSKVLGVVVGGGVPEASFALAPNSSPENLESLRDARKVESSLVLVTALEVIFVYMKVTLLSGSTPFN